MARSKEDMKKAERKADEGLEQRKVRYGKQPHHKMKPYLVLEYLMKQTDIDPVDYDGEPEHVLSAYDISDYLEDNFDIHADRRSIYDDIEEINKVLYALQCIEDGTPIKMDEIDEEFEKAEEEGYLSDLQTVLYDKKRKGFYVRDRRYELNDIRLLAECVYAARFIDKKSAEKLANVALSHLSEAQARKIKHDSFLVDRTKTTNNAVYYSVQVINGAIDRDRKISFRYLKYTINDVNKQAERRQGKEYIVSPLLLLINDGNYYLLAYSDKFQEMRTYRIDRMKGVTVLNAEQRDGEHEYLLMDMNSFAQRTFGMFGGERKGITLRFINPLLDTVIDRFGTKGVRYAKADDGHFRVELEVEVSDQFFGWLLGFGNKVKILGPDSTINAFTAYLDKVRGLY